MEEYKSILLDHAVSASFGLYCTARNSGVRACVEQYLRAIVSSRGTSSDTVCINLVSPGPIQELRLKKSKKEKKI